MTAKKDSDQEKAVILTPSHDALKINGKIIYTEGVQAWSTIRLKKEIISKFPQLKDKSGNFSYVMIIPESYEDIKKDISEIEKNEKTIPVLLFFCRNSE